MIDPAFRDLDPATPAPPIDEPWYFPVSVSKLLVMSIASFGAYQIYWHYRNWKRYRARSTRRFSVLLRTFFAPLFCFRLFERMHHDSREAGLAGLPEPGVLALAYLCLNALLALPEPWWVLTFLNVVPLMVVQARVNQLHAAVTPTARRNDAYSGANVALIVAGVFLFLMMLLGLLFPPPERDVSPAVPVRAAQITDYQPSPPQTATRLDPPTAPG